MGCHSEKDEEPGGGEGIYRESCLKADLFILSMPVCCLAKVPLVVRGWPPLGGER